MNGPSHSPASALPIGANVGAEATIFRVWAPTTTRVDLVIERSAATGPPVVHPMSPSPDGFHAVAVDDAPAGTLYRYRLDGQGPFPDPASRWQPLGVHGPSAVVDPTTFHWSDDAWPGLPLTRTVLYELHVGTFTPDGTFAGAATRLPYLADLGVTAVLVMPVADFPGTRNWGYDGVAPFAPARCYGSPDDFRRFVDAAHGSGLAVHLDVVYNHLGPDGAYQATFSPYYYSTTHTNPWGAAINFDGPHSGPVRAYFIENACRWVHEYHIDGLRLDATHAITDTGSRHILSELAEAVRASVAGTTREVVVVAEDERNLNTIVLPRAKGGWQLDGVWADDFHHHLRRALAGDRDGYFADFDGTAASVALTARQGWFYTGQPSAYGGTRRGTDPAGVAHEQCVICLQNHDQIGNRAFGERLNHQIAAAAWRAASTLLLILPETPLLFMGQEWSASATFLYFTDHEEGLGRLVTEGRRREFARFTAFADPATRERIPDPQAASTFERSKLDWLERDQPPHAHSLNLYRALLHLRRTLTPSSVDDGVFDARADGTDTVVVRRRHHNGAHLLAVVRLAGAGLVVVDNPTWRPPSGHTWRRQLTTEDAAFAPDGQVPQLASDGTAVTFHRPGAMVLVSGPSTEET